jgi:hypothetical protein
MVRRGVGTPLGGSWPLGQTFRLSVDCGAADGAGVGAAVGVAWTGTRLTRRNARSEAERHGIGRPPDEGNERRHEGEDDSTDDDQQIPKSADTRVVLIDRIIANFDGTFDLGPFSSRSDGGLISSASISDRRISRRFRELETRATAVSIKASISCFGSKSTNKTLAACMLLSRALDGCSSPAIQWSLKKTFAYARFF